MSECLGRDCDGRELRAGDRVEPAVPKRRIDMAAHHLPLFTLSGETVTDSRGYALVFCERDADGDEICGRPHALRLINSGRELFDQCAREADKMPSESTIRRAMPRTEPEES